MKITKEKYEEIVKVVSAAYRCYLGGTSEYVFFNKDDGNVWVSHRPITDYNRVERSNCVLIADFGSGGLKDFDGAEFSHGYIDYPTTIKSSRMNAAVDWDDPNHMYTSAYRVHCEHMLQEYDWEETYRDWVDSGLKSNDIEVE